MNNGSASKKRAGSRPAGAALLALLLSHAAPTFCRGEEPQYLEITAPTRSAGIRLQIAATPADADSRHGAEELRQLFGFDFGMTGRFSLEPEVGEPSGGGLLLEARYQRGSARASLECRLVDRDLGRTLMGKRFTGEDRDLRRMGHACSADAVLAVTGERWPFLAKLAQVSRRGSAKEIVVTDYDGFNRQAVTNNGSINLSPEFDPTGREMIYTSYKLGGQRLYRRELYTGKEACISSRQGLNATASFSPDGKKIALALSKDGNSEIYLITPDGRELARLTDHPAIDVAPSWSPDGRFIAYVSDRTGKPQIYVTSDDGKTVRRLTSGNSYNVTPRWSPDGTRIIYARQEGGAFQIHSMLADGSQDAKLTSLGSNQQPHWSPDGRLIAFTSNRDGAEKSYLMRPDGTGQTPLQGSEHASNPSWSKAR